MRYPPEVHLPVAAQPDIQTTISFIEHAEALGYARVWSPETWGRDAVATLAAASTSLEHTDLGTSILNVYSRSPALRGQTAVTLAELAPGDFRLGIGPSGPGVVERWHGLGYDRPLRRTREATEIIRMATAGEVVDYDGDIFELEGFRLRCNPPDRPIPVDLAGLGPKAVELAGFIGDGWHALMVTQEGIAARLEDLTRGAERAGRDPDEIRVTLSVTCCAKEDAAKARRLVAEHIGFYLGSMGPFYARALAEQGRREVVETIVSAWRGGERDVAVETIETELLDDLAAAGTPQDVRESLEEFESVDGIDAIAVSFPRGASPEETSETLEAIVR